MMPFRPENKIWLALVMVLGISGGGFAISNGARRAYNVATYSEERLLSDSWRDYKKRFCTQAGAVVDPSGGGVVTSEGESYAMLRAVWENDRPAFDLSWQWTRETIQHQSDHLFSWLCMKNSAGRYVVNVDAGGANSAADADTDIALALVFAFARWHDRTYLEEARDIVRDIWTFEVVNLSGGPVVAADNLESRSQRPAVLNPSYFEPYAYRIFARIDPEHNWLAAVPSSYRLLEECISGNLGSRRGTAGIPPDWVVLDRNTGALKAVRAGNMTSDFGADASRVPWRLAVDWEWNRDPKALELLQKMSFLSGQWKTRRKISARYLHDGRIRQDVEDIAMYGGSLGYFLEVEPSLASEIYERKIEGAYDREGCSWHQGYYSENWAWFAAALKMHKTVNLAKTAAF